MATLEDENGIVKGLSSIANLTFSGSENIAATIKYENDKTNSRIDELREVINEFKNEVIKNSSSNEKENEEPNTAVQDSLLSLDDAIYAIYLRLFTIKSILSTHFAMVEANNTKLLKLQEENNLDTKETLYNLTGSITEYFETAAEQNEEQNTNLIGSMIGGIKGFFGAMFSSGLSKIFKGVQVSITKSTIKDFAGVFKPLIAASSVAANKQGGVKSMIGNKVGQAAGKGTENIVSALATTVSKIGNAIVRFINIWATGAPLVPPLLAAALVIVVGLYFIVDLIITTFFPLFEMIANAIVDFFPQVLDTIMAASPFGAIVLIVKTIAKLIAALSNTSLDGNQGKSEGINYSKPLEEITEILKLMLIGISTGKVSAAAINKYNSTNAIMTNNTASASSNISNAANAVTQNTSAETAQNESSITTVFGVFSDTLLQPFNDLKSAIADFVNAVADFKRYEPIQSAGSSSISYQNMNQVNRTNNISPADGVMQGGNSIQYTSFNNTQYSDLLGKNDNKDVVEKLADIISLLKEMKNEEEFNRYSSEHRAQGD